MMKYNKIVNSNDIKNKNSFLVACVFSIVLLLTMCYFGINSNIKGTAAATVYTCDGGATTQTSSICTKTVKKTYVYDETKTCAEVLDSSWSGSCESSLVDNNAAIPSYEHDCTCTKPAEVVGSNDDNITSDDDNTDSVEYKCYGCLSGKYVWSDYFPKESCVTGWFSAAASKCSSQEKPVASCYCFNGNAAHCSYYVNPPGEAYQGADDSMCSSSNGEEDDSGDGDQCHDGGGYYYWGTGGSGNAPLVSQYKTQEDCEGANQCYQCNDPKTIYHWGYSYSNASSECQSRWHTVSLSKSQCVSNNSSNDGNMTTVTVTFMNGTSTVDTKTCKYNDTIGEVKCSVTPPSAPSKTNYTFTGWGISSTCSSGKTSGFDETKDVTYYACWVYSGSGGGGGGNTTKTFKATFDANGGTLNGSSTKSCSTAGSSCSVTDLPTVSKNGYTFKGWGTNSSCTSGSTSSLTLDSDKTFYACYVSNSSDNNSGDNGGGNVEENPSTGEITIALVWFFGIFAIAYSFVYFKQVREK